MQCVTLLMLQFSNKMNRFVLDKHVIAYLGLVEIRCYRSPTNCFYYGFRTT
jgi:hypothetical protein